LAQATQSALICGVEAALGSLAPAVRRRPRLARMGCGASTRAVPPKDAQAAAEADAEVDTWATKTSAPCTKEGWANQTEVETFTSPKGGSIPSTKSEKAASDGAMLVIDADEDDDGVEVIYESPPNWQASRQAAAANGQEPPDTGNGQEGPMAEEVRRPEPEPLSKQQQEEAAKLAETRKRFEAKRLNQQKSSPDMIVFDMPGAIDTGEDVSNLPVEVVATAKGPPAREERKDIGPKSDLNTMIGLSVTETFVQDIADPFGRLPGGIFDELEGIQQPPMDSKNREQQHDEVKSRGFDDEDEMMMKEILDNFDA